MRVTIALLCLLLTECQSTDDPSDDPSANAIGVLNIGGHVIVKTGSDNEDDEDPVYSWTTPRKECHVPRHVR